MPLRLEILTPEKAVYDDEVDMVIAPGSEGYLGILPHHAPLFTTLGPGELRVKRAGVEEALAVFGGFMDVR
ncbi:MAG: ATP synthase F1 subunit epsilon, partial [Chloroflexota bacterium]|nr:ATP synthase F1 subunit epsilon [Chloroflexota bacterium]